MDLTGIIIPLEICGAAALMLVGALSLIAGIRMAINMFKLGSGGAAPTSIITKDKNYYRTRNEYRRTKKTTYGRFLRANNY